ncbi:hypothetical protein GQ43DRAFT_257374 [Delitschia confertaspora ATCC 74209]|uniref:Uncharacterized protein n=1 Tax=Delitschia confertaspora ATCC 74209 TaxID=1513339 RepID=A0A9P4MTT2_9PLEO|nr:hypothetical protein GQ43DRAFT_257374 [Delitschia confertaspora ATCC 74209]
MEKIFPRRGLGVCLYTQLFRIASSPFLRTVIRELKAVFIHLFFYTASMSYRRMYPFIFLVFTNIIILVHTPNDCGLWMFWPFITKLALLYIDLK